MNPAKVTDLIIRNNPQAVGQNLYNEGLVQSPTNLGPQDIFQTLLNRCMQLEGNESDQFLMRMISVPILTNQPGAKELMDWQTQMGFQPKMQDLKIENTAKVPSIKKSYFRSDENGFQLKLNWSWNKLLKILGIGVLSLVFFQLLRFTFTKKSD